jgi:hypothetical protein
MPGLTPKQLRTLDFAIQRLFTANSVHSSNNLKELAAAGNLLARQLRLGGGRSIFLSDSGVEHLQTLFGTIYDADLFAGLAGYSDIAVASRDVIEKLLSDGQMPDGGAEFVGLVQQNITSRISQHTFVVPVFGVELADVEVIDLGLAKIVRSPADVIKAQNVDCGDDVPELPVDQKHYLWIVGSTSGTPRIAEERFRRLAELTTGVLAIAAASRYQRGASAFCIGIAMRPEQRYGRAAWFSWDDKNHKLMRHHQFVSSQPFPLNAAFVTELSEGSPITDIFVICETTSRTELEDAIVKAVYWFSDAHRDQVSVMQFIKYWSCVEAFFSPSTEAVTKAVSTGLATVLIFGGFNFIPSAEYGAFKRKVTKLYAHRSRALHRATFEHVSSRDVADLSQMVAWLVVTMTSLSRRGYSTLKAVNEQAARLDSIQSRQRQTGQRE